jgi:sugar/nucleoside kinase (ribokinase family)/antitoxin component of MazEF toxin-antitoxin module
MHRKITRTGPKSVTITLPPEWLKENDLSPGDEIEILPENKHLLIKPTDSKKDTEINLNYNSIFINNLLEKVAKENYEKITIASQNKIPDLTELIEKIIPHYEISSSSENKIILEKIFSNDSQKNSILLRKLFRITSLTTSSIISKKDFLEEKNFQKTISLLRISDQEKIISLMLEGIFDKLIKIKDLHKSNVEALKYFNQTFEKVYKQKYDFNNENAKDLKHIFSVYEKQFKSFFQSTKDAFQLTEIFNCFSFLRLINEYIISEQSTELLENIRSPKKSISIIGSLCKDKIIYPDKELNKIGSPVYHIGLALSYLGLKVNAFTKLSKKDQELLEELSHANLEIFPIFSDKTVHITNIFKQKNLSKKDYIITNIDKIKFQPEIFSSKTMEKLQKSSIIHLGPLHRDEFDVDLVKFLKKKSKISLDSQHMIQKISKNGKVKYFGWPEKEKILKYIDILFLSEDWLFTFTKSKTLKKAMKELSLSGPTEIIVTRGQKGSLIFSKNKFYEIPSFQIQSVGDKNGAGVTYIAGYLRERINNNNLQEVGEFASMCATMKIESMFNLTSDYKTVKNRIKEISDKKSIEV